MIAIKEQTYSYAELNAMNDRELDAIAYSRVMNGHVVIGVNGEPYKMTIEKMESSHRGLVPRYSTDKSIAIRLALELADRKMGGRFAEWVYELSEGELITTDKHYEPCVNMDVLFGIITVGARQLTIAAILSTQFDVDGVTNNNGENN